MANTNQIETLNKTVAACCAAMPYLKGCARTQNVARLAAAVEELETAQAAQDLVQRFGAAEIQRCEVASL